MSGEGTRLSIRMYGSNVTEQSIQQVAEATRGLLQAVEHEMTGAQQLDWRIGPAKRCCDGCDAVAPTLDLPVGWINQGGMDYCTSCLYGGER